MSEDIRGKEMDWDDEVEVNEYILLPEGDYDFVVESFERGRYEGSNKMPPCNRALLKIRIDAQEGTTVMNESLFLYDKMAWKIAEFFLSIGFEKGENGKRIVADHEAGLLSVQMALAEPALLDHFFQILHHIPPGFSQMLCQFFYIAIFPAAQTADVAAEPLDSPADAAACRRHAAESCRKNRRTPAGCPKAGAHVPGSDPGQYDHCQPDQ